MWDLVGNPEDRFSHNEAHFGIASVNYSSQICIYLEFRFKSDVNFVIASVIHRFTGNSALVIFQTVNIIFLDAEEFVNDSQRVFFKENTFIMMPSQVAYL